MNAATATRTTTPTRGSNIPGTATDIAAGADGTAWHVNKNGDIFRYAGDQPS
ncbi:hypothetical protein [Streptomyces parvus]|uniref:hypothetical protein n=1 Tax=Streptomyces parvus TaxID=66428 RepID=UPI0028AE9A07|nr:hypothetical protein [Streptomyces parvus]